MHVNPHLDEIFAWWLLWKFSLNEIDPKPEFVKDQPKQTDAQHDAARIIPIGLGGGRFDEHRLEGRLPDTCASRLVAEFLLVADHADLDALLKRVCYTDNHTGTHEFDLASLVKVATRRLKNGDHLVVRWATEAIEAIVAAHATGAKPGEICLADIIRELRGRDYFESEKILQRMFTLAGESRKGVHVTDLAYIVSALQRTGTSREDTIDWCRFALEHYYADQVEFHECVAHCAAHTKSYEGVGERGTYVISVVESSSPVALRAMRFDDRRRDVIVIRNPETGHVGIFAEKAAGFRMNNAVAMLRWLELPKRLKALPTWTQLQSEQDLCELEGHPTWYYHRKAESVHNGTITHPGVPATRLHPDAIIHVLQHAFGLRSVIKWANERNIRLNR